MSFKKVLLKKGRDYSVTSRHPWVFSGGIYQIPEKVQPGEAVNVLDNEGKFLAFGHYFSRDIAVKIASFQQVSSETELLSERLSRAIKSREALGLLPLNNTTNAIRLFNAEGDGFPSLIIDLYKDVAVIESHSLAVNRLIPEISSELKKLLPFLGDIKSKVEGETSKEDSQEVTIYENGISYLVDVGRGQKTGFFIDQRESRALLRSVSNHKRVLNTFSYTGGFSISALLGGASEVISVDSSKSALALLEKNLSINNLSANHQTIEEDCFDYLKKQQKHFDIVILDPPALVKFRSAKKNAIRAYQQINKNAMQHISNGGLLFTYSCSGHISLDEFVDCVRAGALQAGKQAKVLKILGPGMDHPWNLNHAEGRYLKGLLVEVGD